MSTILKPRLLEVLKSGKGIYRTAKNQGMSLSAWLNKEYAEDIKGSDLDAFETILREIELPDGKGIIVQSIPEKGIYADKVERFFATEDSSIIFPEWINRTAREALKDDSILNELVGLRTGITSGTYETVNITVTDDDVTKKRVVEGSELPEATIASSENSIKLRKYGRQVKTTYEAARRATIDKFALTIKAILRQSSVDRATACYNVLMDGDGNSNAATVKEVNGTYGETADAISYTSWMNFRMDLYPHELTTLVGNKAALIKFLTKDAPDIDPLKLFAQLGYDNMNERGTIAQNIFGNYRVVYLPTATANKLLGLDKNYAVEMVSEIGADLSEVDKLVTTQWNVIALSEVNGFGIVLPNARLVLDYST